MWWQNNQYDLRLASVVSVIQIQLRLSVQNKRYDHTINVSYE